MKLGSILAWPGATFTDLEKRGAKETMFRENQTNNKRRR